MLTGVPPKAFLCDLGTLNICNTKKLRNLCIQPRKKTCLNTSFLLTVLYVNAKNSENFCRCYFFVIYYFIISLDNVCKSEVDILNYEQPVQKNITYFLMHRIFNAFYYLYRVAARWKIYVN